MAVDVSQDAAMAAKRAQDSELVALKQQMDRLKNQLTPGQNGQQKMRKACTDFEAVFIGKMWEQMRSTIPKGGILHSPQEDMYRSMFDKEFSEKLASDGGIGLGDMLYNQLKDKIKNTSKTLGKLDNGTTASAQAQASSSSPTSSTTGTATPDAASAGATPANLTSTLSRIVSEGPAGALHGAASSGAAGSKGLERTVFTAPKRPMGAVSQGASTGAAAAAGAASAVSTSGAAASASLPASVPGGVMADVEALARRIEADFDRRQAQASLQTGQTGQTGQTAQSGQAGPIVQAGQGGTGDSSGQVAGYGRSATGRSTGSRLATIG